MFKNIANNSYKLLKSDSSDALLYISITFITNLGNIIIIPLLWAKISPADFGIIAITEIINLFLSVVMTLSIEQSLTRYYYEWRETERSRNSGTLWLLSWLSVIFFGFFSIPMFYFISPFIFKDIEFFPYIFIGIILALFTGFASLPTSYLRIKKLSLTFFVYRLSMFIIQILLIILFVFVLNYKVIGYLTSLGITGFISTLVLFIIMIKNTSIKISGSREVIKKSFQFSLPMLPSILLSNFSNILDRLLLQRLSDLSTLGLYSIALKFIGLIAQMHGALKMAYGPFFMENVFTKSGVIKIHDKMKFYILPIFTITLLLILFIQDIVHLFDNPAYFDTIYIVPLLAFITFISSLNIYYANGIILSKRTKFLNIPSLIQIFSLSVFSYILIPEFQIYGILTSKLITSILFFSSSVIISNILYKLSYDWRTLITFLSILVLTLLLKYFFQFLGIHVHSVILIFYLTFIIFLLAKLNIIPFNKIYSSILRK